MISGSLGLRSLLQNDTNNILNWTAESNPVLAKLMKVEPVITIDVGDKLLINDFTLLTVLGIDEATETIYLSEGYYFCEADAIRKLKHPSEQEKEIITIFQVIE